MDYLPPLLRDSLAMLSQCADSVRDGLLIFPWRWDKRFVLVFFFFCICFLPRTLGGVERNLIGREGNSKSALVLGIVCIKMDGLGNRISHTEYMYVQVG